MPARKKRKKRKKERKKRKKEGKKERKKERRKERKKESEVAHLCPTLCDPVDCSPPGSSVHGFSQARMLALVAIFFSRGSSRPRDWTCVSCIAGRFFTTEPPGKSIIGYCCCCWVASVVSNSVRPHRPQSTRLPRPWDSPGKNTGVGCHFLLYAGKWKVKVKSLKSCPTLRDPMDCSLPGSSIHGIFQARVFEWGAIAFSNNSIRQP